MAAQVPALPKHDHHVGGTWARGGIRSICYEIVEYLLTIVRSSWDKTKSTMVGGGDCKVATVEVEAAAGGDNTATLPVTRPLNPQNSPPNAQDNAEKNNAANKEMELKNVRSTPAKK